MKRGRQGFVVERERELPKNAKKMKLILHMVRKERYDCWNELRIYDFGSDKEAFIVSDRNYLRVPDPDERYYFYFYTEHEDNNTYCHYVKIEKGTSLKGFLSWKEVKDKVQEYRNGIYKIIYITEEGKPLIGLLEFRINDVEFLYEPELMERQRVVENEDVYVYVFENATINEINEKVYLLRPCKVLNVIIVKSKKQAVIPIDKNTGYYKAEISYSPSRNVFIYEVQQRDFDNIMLKAYVDGRYKLIPIN